MDNFSIHRAILTYCTLVSVKYSLPVRSGKHLRRVVESLELNDLFSQVIVLMPCKQLFVEIRKSRILSILDSATYALKGV